MSRSKYTTPAQQLLEEAQSIELLMNELSPNATEMEDYWNLSLRLIDLVSGIEALNEQTETSLGDPAYQRLRGELTALESQIMEMSGAHEV